jgi:hypothetical protein
VANTTVHPVAVLTIEVAVGEYVTRNGDRIYATRDGYLMTRDSLGNWSVGAYAGGPVCNADQMQPPKTAEVSINDICGMVNVLGRLARELGCDGKVGFSIAPITYDSGARVMVDVPCYTSPSNSYLSGLTLMADNPAELGTKIVEPMLKRIAEMAAYYGRLSTARAYAHGDTMRLLGKLTLPQVNLPPQKEPAA